MAIVQSPPQILNPDRDSQDLPCTRLSTTRQNQTDGDVSLVSTTFGNTNNTRRIAAEEIPGQSRHGQEEEVAATPRPQRSSWRLGARVQDHQSSERQRRQWTDPLSYFRRLRQHSKVVKELKLAQQSIARQIQEHRATILTFGTCRQDQQTKRICKLNSCQTELSRELDSHCNALIALPYDNLGRKDKRRINRMRVHLSILQTTHREQVELVTTLYSTRLSQERNRVSRLRDEQRQLQETLRDYGAALKALNGSRQHSVGIRKRGCKQQRLASKISALGDAIQSINLNTLENDHVKKMKRVEGDLVSLLKQVGDHGASIQSLCSVHHFLGNELGPDHEC